MNGVVRMRDKIWTGEMNGYLLGARHAGRPYKHIACLINSFYRKGFTAAQVAGRYRTLKRDIECKARFNRKADL